MPKPGGKRSQTTSIRLVMLGFMGLAVLVGFLLIGQDVKLLNPQGYIAYRQMDLMLVSTAIMMVIALPTLFLLYYFAWKYREGNHRATYKQHIQHGKYFAVKLWAIPSVIMVILVSIMWPATHQLAPQKSIAANTKPLTIQVVALRWKWLFIYPEEQIATVNYVQLPVDVPVRFNLTADEAPMNSFWIPHLGGQLYAMTGHDNRLNLMAEQIGDYGGNAAEINGPGFAGMKFTTRVSSQEDFAIWVQRVKQTDNVLSDDAYKALVKPSENHAVALYSRADANLYDTILEKYGGSHHHSVEPAVYKKEH